MGRRKKIDEELQRDLKGSALAELLTLCGLPDDYPKLTPFQRRKARLHVLTSWYSTFKPQLLCTSETAYVQAHRLFTEFYLKPVNPHIYFFDDHMDKYEMVRMVMSPPKDPERPAKSLVVATRRTMKTQALVVEAMTLMAVSRPFTTCLLSELNDERTREEIGKIKDQVEVNERIHEDFGGYGESWRPSGRGALTWSNHHLKFCNGSEILGHSLGSAQRGRGPLYGVIDDPEDEDNTYNLEWRRWFFSKLFNLYTFMFHFGGKIVWIGTPVDACSCLSIAQRGMSEKDGADEPSSDPRFLDWRRGKYTRIRRTPEGSYESRQPQALSVEGFLRLLESDPIAARKEVLCEPVTPGIRVFSFDPLKHGYMHCKRPDGSEYMLDLYTGEIMDWKEFLKGLRVYGAGDLSSGMNEDCDPGALVFHGLRGNGVRYILDCYVRRCYADHLIEKGYFLAEVWDAEKLAWEQGSMQVVIARIALKYVEALRAQGKDPPLFVGIDNAWKNKVRRITNLLHPLFRDHTIRFLVQTPIKGPDGQVHTPVDSPHRGMYDELLNQIQEFTDEGLRGPDDAIDGLEMCVRISLGDAGVEDQTVHTHKSDEVAAWAASVNDPIDPLLIPEEARSPKMQQEVEERWTKSVFGPTDELDPDELEELAPYV